MNIVFAEKNGFPNRIESFLFRFFQANLAEVRAKRFLNRIESPHLRKNDFIESQRIKIEPNRIAANRIEPRRIESNRIQ